MFEFELLDNADAVVQVIIAIFKLLIFVLVIRMLWELRTPSQSLFKAGDDLQRGKPAEQTAEVAYGKYDNQFWQTDPDSTREFGTYLPGGKTSCGFDPLEELAQDDSLTASRKKESPDGL